MLKIKNILKVKLFLLNIMNTFGMKKEEVSIENQKTFIINDNLKSIDYLFYVISGCKNISYKKKIFYNTPIGLYLKNNKFNFDVDLTEKDLTKLYNFYFDTNINQNNLTVEKVENLLEFLTEHFYKCNFSTEAIYKILFDFSKIILIKHLDGIANDLYINIFYNNCFKEKNKPITIEFFIDQFIENFLNEKQFAFFKGFLMQKLNFQLNNKKHDLSSDIEEIKSIIKNTWFLKKNMKDIGYEFSSDHMAFLLSVINYKQNYVVCANIMNNDFIIKKNKSIEESIFNYLQKNNLNTNNDIEKLVIEISFKEELKEKKIGYLLEETKKEILAEKENIKNIFPQLKEITITTDYNYNNY
jgi:hypothetical protein